MISTIHSTYVEDMMYFNYFSWFPKHMYTITSNTKEKMEYDPKGEAFRIG
jgi:hypothetical protein